jgi:hypothetical protein
MAKGDVAKPKGRMTAYAYFVKNCRDEHTKKHPNEGVAFAEFSKKCAERWKVSVMITNATFLRNASVRTNPDCLC